MRHDEKARLKELRDARDFARQCQEECAEFEEDADNYHAYRDELERLFGVGTPHQAWLKLEAAQNEAEMWKEKAVS